MNIGEHIAGLLGLNGITEDLKDVAILGATTAATLLAASAIVERVPYLKQMAIDKPAYIAAGAVVIGTVGGLAIGKYAHRGVGFSFCAALTGWGLAKLAVKYAPASLKLSLGGLSAGSNDLLLGLGDFRTRSVQRSPGMAGLGAHGANVTRDVSRQPGGSWGGLAATLS